MANRSNPNPWLYAGSASSYPNIDPASADHTARLCRPPPDPWDAPTPEDALPQPCKVFRGTPTTTTTLEQQPLDSAEPSSILVFKYRDTIHAVAHGCPHQSYPLTRGTLADIEDFGILLSVGITCPKHGWTFDLHTGEADRGRYRLGLYEVELRRGGASGDEEVWVRKKERRRIG